MGKLKNYILATAGLVILGGTVQFVIPLQAAPPAKDVNVINETMVISLVDDMALPPNGIDLDPIDVSGFRFVSFHGISDAASFQMAFRFSTQEGKFNELVPKTEAAACIINPGNGATCSSAEPSQSFRVKGPFLLIHVDDRNTFKLTLQVFLSR